MGIRDRLAGWTSDSSGRLAAAAALVTTVGLLAVQIGTRLLLSQHEELTAELAELRDSRDMHARLHGETLAELDDYREHFGPLPEEALRDEPLLAEVAPLEEELRGRHELPLVDEHQAHEADG